MKETNSFEFDNDINDNSVYCWKNFRRKFKYWFAKFEFEIMFWHHRSYSK